jgi:flagellum-specific peptidoglycan hydrolase FlgJ
MESQTGENTVALTESMERMEARLEAAASLLERTAAQMEERESERSGEVRKIVAAVETSREAELQKKLDAAELQIAELRAQVESQIASQVEAKSETQPKAARRTVPASTTQFLAKQGIASLDSLEAGTLDAALNGLSLEQRIAVKAQLLRAGVVS